MLTNIVRPMVRTQIRLLASSQSPHSTLVATIVQWLGLLGVQAKVTQLATDSNQIQVALTVSKPDACEPEDWQQILENLNTGNDANRGDGSATLSEIQQRKLQRFLAHVIQAGNPDCVNAWDELYPQLQSLGFTEPMLLGIKAAIRVPQPLELLLADLEPDTAAIALSDAIGITLLDRQVNYRENQILSVLLDLIKQSNPTPQ
uniref:Uncharacterized protein n=1 Tax=Cyanothece sp. (strain PCC 7425 / ATCC 29141) TaxID=395961 RepID=B8HRI2_CYAP4